MTSRAGDLLLPGADAAGEKAPRASHPGADGGKKPPAAFGRVWSEADEVRILEGLAAHAAGHGAPPARSQLHAVLAGRGLDKADFTVTEIYEKVRRLRIKYWNLRSAGGASVPAGGGDDGNELRKYELSTVIWGNQPAPGPTPPKVTKKQGSTVANVVAPKVANKVGGTVVDSSPATRVRRGFEELRGLFPSLAMAVEGIVKDLNDDLLGSVLTRAFELIADQDAGALDAKAKKQRVKEAQMTMSQTTVRNEVLSALVRSID